MLKKIKDLYKKSTDSPIKVPYLKWGKKIQKDNLSLSEKERVDIHVLRNNQAQEKYFENKWKQFKENKDEGFNDYLENNNVVKNEKPKIITMFLVFITLIFLASIYLSGVALDSWERTLAKISSEKIAKDYYYFDMVMINEIRFIFMMYFVVIVGLIGVCSYLEVKKSKKKKEQAFKEYLEEVKEMYSSFNLLTIFMDENKFKDDECYVFMSLLKEKINNEVDNIETPLLLSEIIDKYEFRLDDMETDEFIKWKEQSDKYFISIRDEIYKEEPSGFMALEGERLGENKVRYMDLEDEQSIDNMINTLMKKKELLKVNNNLDNFS